MGHSSSMHAILLFLSSMEAALRLQGHRVPPGAGAAAATPSDLSTLIRLN